MPLSFLRRHSWWILLLACIAFVVWTDRARIRRIEYVTNVGRETPAPTFPGAAAFRYLIIPEHISGSYKWIAQTQQMIERGDWRVRVTDSENAPFGRDVHSASPYRWWFALVTKAVQALTGKPLVAAAEHAALVADPALHVLLLVVTAVVVWRWFGSAASAMAALSLTLLFPLGAGFLPGVPEDFSLLLFLTPWCVLPLLVPMLGRDAVSSVTAPAGRPAVRPHRWFFAAGCIGALALWISVPVQVPLLAGIALGGIVAAFVARRLQGTSLPADVWRAWGFGGASTVLITYLLEYAPAHLGEWELRAIHPLYGVAWIGGAELVTRIVDWIQGGQRPRGWRDYAVLGLGMAGAASLPVVMWRLGNLGFINIDLLSFRLSKQAEGVHASHLWEWITRQGLTATSAATLVPSMLLAFALWLAFRRATPAAVRIALAFTLGVLPIALLLAGFQLRWWQTAQALALPAFIATLAGCNALPRGAWLRIGWVCSFGVCLVLGVSQLLPVKELRGQNVLTVAEVEGLVERDLAHSLARRLASGRDGVVLAPPSVTSALNYYAGLRGLSSLSWENKAGLSVALRIVISTSREEAHALVQNRGITHIVVPSWDPFFETFIRAASVQNGELLFTSLRRWVIPFWLRPVPHELPKIGGFEDQSLSVFEVVDEQEPAIGMSRVAEYFIEMGQADAAKAAGEALRRYPGDFSAVIAQASIEAAANDAKSFSATLETIVQRLNTRADRLLPWDRRVSLAVALARGKRNDLARTQLERCVRDATEERVRTLTAGSLFHFLYLARALQVEFEHPKVRELALQLLPAETRARL